MKSQTNQLFMFALVTGLLTLLGFSDPSYAVPASPGVFDVSQPDGAVFKARLVGDEHRNWTETEAGFSIAKAANGYWQYLQNSQSPILTGIPAHHGPPAGVVQHARPVTGPSTAPTVGEIQAALGVAPVGNFSGSVLYILADFTDRAGTYNEASWATIVSDKVADYYSKASYGKVTLTPAVESYGTANNGVVGWLNMGYAHPNTANNPGVAANQMLVRDAITAADPYVDYASYDTNANGFVEPEELAIVVITAGYETSYGGAVAPSTWGHQWSTGFYAPVVDGKTIYSYCMFGETHASGIGTPHQATMGIQVHELGHLIFGLPDLYDTDGSSQGIGYWGLMSSGSWGSKTGEHLGTTPVLPSAWSKYKKGWVFGTANPGVKSFQAAGSATATSTNTVARISTSNPDEYFLVENRQNTGYDQGMQYHTGGSFGGLAIWHIDENILTNSNDAHRKVDLEAADGYAGGGTNSVSDLWYVGNKTTFDSLSSPNSHLYSGLPSGASVDNISASGNIMTATLATTVSVSGCTDPWAPNYDPLATIDDGSCILTVPGCTDPTALNYDPLADVDDGSCAYPVYGCTDPTAINYDPLAATDDGSCAYPVNGCTDPVAINYNPLANVDDGSCTYPPPVTYNVTKTEDTNDGVCDADCSLREAINAANTSGATDTINLLAETYLITLGGSTEDSGATGDFDIRQSINIVGAGVGLSIIRGETLDRMFEIHGGIVSISGVSIEGGVQGAIRNNGGMLTITDSAVTNNTNMYSLGGAVINTSGTLTVNNCTISGNTANWDGGGILNYGTLIVTGSTISNNQAMREGGGILNHGALTVTNSTISNNTAAYYGGGIASSGYLENGTVVAVTTTITSSTISGNTATHVGGGIRFRSGTAIITGSTISGNTCNSAGGISNTGTLTVANSTISGNTALLYSGGGVHNSTSATFINTTITGNTAPTGAGIRLWTANAAVDFSNSIVANQLLGLGGTGGVDCAVGGTGTITSSGYNLDSDGTCGFTGIGDMQNSDSLLSLLADNGGLTMTHAFYAGSPAKDSGSCVNTTDQRGLPRPDGAGCDIGAYEGPGVASKAANDFNGDNMSDLLWRKDSTGANYVWQMNGTTRTGCNPGGVKTTWSVAGIGNFDGVGGSDILWRHNTTGWNQMWFMNGCTKTSLPTLGVATTWSVAAIGDFDNDGKSDILWRKNSTGANYVWLMNGTTKTTGCLHSGTSTTSSVVGTGDFDSDGTTDILWNDSATGANSIWFMNGCTKTTGNPGASPASMSVAGVGNFDGLAGSDILWRNSATGVNSVWLMTGAAKTVCNPGGANPLWSVAKVGDYDGDGKSDLVWRKNSTGANYVWFMNGCAKVGGSISGVSNIWSMP